MEIRPLERIDVVAVGASTGGPRALVELLDSLSASFPYPILIAQHIDSGFVDGFIKWLNTLLDLDVVAAPAGTKLQPGTVYVLPTTGRVCIDQRLVLDYAAADPEQLYVPNIDLFFSALLQAKLRGMAFLMSGMGRDGAEGLKKLAADGWQTFVQNPKSCIVDGMPSAALKLYGQHQVKTPAELSRFLRNEEILTSRRIHGER